MVPAGDSPYLRNFSVTDELEFLINGDFGCFGAYQCEMMSNLITLRKSYRRGLDPKILRIKNFLLAKIFKKNKISVSNISFFSLLSQRIPRACVTHENG